MVEKIKEIIPLAQEQAENNNGETLIVNRYLSPNNTEILGLNPLVKFQPHFNHHFVCSIPFFDTWMVKDVFVPPLKARCNSNGVYQIIAENYQPIKIVLHDVQAPSTKQCIFEAFKTFPKLSQEDKEGIQITLKQIDPVGHVVSHIEFKNINFEKFEMLSDLSYNNNSLSTITLYVSFENCELKY